MVHLAFSGMAVSGASGCCASTTALVCVCWFGSAAGDSSVAPVAAAAAAVAVAVAACASGCCSFCFVACGLLSFAILLIERRVCYICCSQFFLVVLAATVSPISQK